MAHTIAVFDLQGRLFPDDPHVRTIGVITRFVDLDVRTDRAIAARIADVIRAVELEQRARDPAVVAVFRELQRIP